MLDVFDQLISKETLPELPLMCLSAGRSGEVYVLHRQFLNHAHALLNVSSIVSVVVSI